MTAPDTSAYATDAPRAATGERKLIVIWQDPALLRTEALRQGGLEFLSAIRDGTLPPAPIQQLLNFSLDWPLRAIAAPAGDPQPSAQPPR